MLFVEKLFLWFLFYSFCGWVYESILVSILERRPVNRGFLNGPLCPIYCVLSSCYRPVWREFSFRKSGRF